MGPRSFPQVFCLFACGRSALAQFRERSGFQMGFSVPGHLQLRDPEQVTQARGTCFLVYGMLTVVIPTFQGLTDVRIP